MVLARAWMRQLAGASGVALLVPLSIAASLAVLAISGGFSRLGSFGQVFSGPSVPVASRVSAKGAAAAARLDRVLAALPIRTTQAGLGSAGAGTTLGRGASRAGSRHGAHPRSAPGSVASLSGVRGTSASSSTTSTGAAGSGSGSSSGSGGSGGAGGNPVSHLVSKVVSTGTAVVSQVPVPPQVPAPVGSTVSQVVSAAGTQLNHVVASAGGSSPSVPTSSATTSTPVAAPQVPGASTLLP